MNLYEVDKEISKITGDMNFYSYLTPINRNEEREKFFSELGTGGEYNPQFEYRDFNCDIQKEELLNLHGHLGGEGVSLFLRKKIDFILQQLFMLSCDDEGFTKASEEIYGKPSFEVLSVSRNILMMEEGRESCREEENISAQEMAAILRNKIENEKIDWNVQISHKLVPKITVSGRDRILYVNANVNYTKSEVERLKIHEIEVHIYRALNGYKQPYKIFAEGLAGYDDTEEGMAIFVEDKTGCLNIDKRQMRIYAARALCADFCLRGSFFQTFNALREFFPDEVAYRLTERGKRGIKDTSSRGGFTKGVHYIRGWERVKKYVEEGGDLKILYLGKIGIDDVDVVKQMIDRGELIPPQFLPEFLKDDSSHGKT